MSEQVRMICPCCGDDDIRMGQPLSTLQKKDEYYMFTRATCRSCGAPLVAVRSFKERGATELIRREDMKPLYGVKHGIFKGRWA
ncbi:MAG: hypothetical protein Q4Q58_06720 [Thermoplasmata archaeon]|nr:hypothetical protein [Thermoplasmata archaeon]